MFEIPQQRFSWVHKSTEPDTERIKGNNHENVSKRTATWDLICSVKVVVFFVDLLFYARDTYRIKCEEVKKMASDKRKGRRAAANAKPKQICVNACVDRVRSLSIPIVYICDSHHWHQ